MKVESVFSQRRRISLLTATALTAAAMVALPQASQAQLVWNGNGTDGGDGIWHTFVNGEESVPNWINTDGRAIVWGGPNWAVFQGTGGTVTLDGTNSIASAQFLVNGYELNGGTLNIYGHSTNEILVAENVTATIRSTLSGAPLKKTGAGTLVLTNTDGWEGGVSAREGTLVLDGVTLNQVSKTFEAGSGFNSSSGTSDTVEGHLIVRNAAKVTLTGTILGIGGTNTSTGDTSVGSLTLTGANTVLTTDRGLQVGLSGVGTLEITEGAKLEVTSATAQQHIGGTSTPTGSATVKVNKTGQWLGGDAFIGKATLEITEGGVASHNRVYLGYEPSGGTGTALVSGEGSSWSNTSDFFVGYAVSTSTTPGSGALKVTDKAAVNVGNRLYIGYGPASVGTLVVDNGSLTARGALYLGGNAASAGTATISNGAAVSATAVYLANGDGATGTLNIGAAAGEQAVAAGSLAANTVYFRQGTATLVFNHTNQDYVFSSGFSGYSDRGQSSVQFLSGHTIYTGTSTGATIPDLKVEVKGPAIAQIDGVLGGLGGSVTVSQGGTLTGSGQLRNAVTVADGGILKGESGKTLTFGSHLVLDSGASVNVTLGAPSGTELFNVAGDLTLAGMLNVTRAGGFGEGLYRLFSYGGIQTGTLSAGSYDLRYDTEGKTVSLLQGELESFAVWNGGAGVWNATNENWTTADGAASGAFTAPGFAIFDGTANAVTVEGTVQITGTQFAVNGYSLNGGSIQLTEADTTVRVGDGTQTGAGFTATVASALTGAGGLVKDDLGTLVLTGTNTYEGGTTVAAGKLVGNVASIRGNLTNEATTEFNQLEAGTFAGTISGSGTLIKSGTGTLTLTADSNAFTGTTSVTAGGLAVNNRLGGAVEVASGAALSGSGEVGGNVTIADGANLSGAAGQPLTVGGNLTLNSGSVVNVALGAPSETQLFTVGGDLTLDGTLNVADAGSFGSGVYRLFSYAGGLTDNGLAIGTLPQGVNPLLWSVQTSVDNQVNLISQQEGEEIAFWQGGSGEWNASDPNWTDSSGGSSGVYTPATAVFEGEAGTVEVKGTDIRVAGIQFASNGYSVTGTQLELAEAETTIRVGDGSAAGAAYTATVSAALTGAGGLVKNDLGTLVLTGANTYTGGTTVAAGTLRGTAASIRGNVANAATVVFDQASDADFAGVFSGNGRFEKTGAGSLNLTADSGAFAGTTEVQSGNLRVNGKLGGEVQVSGGGRVSGAGEIGKLAVAGGVISPGNSIGTLNIAGDLTIDAGSLYEVETQPGGTNSDRIVVGGIATLNGGTVRHIGEAETASQKYAPSSSYTILTAAGGVVGQFASVSTDFAFLSASLNYQANAVLLQLERNSVAFPDVARTFNQKATAAAVESTLQGHALWDAVVGLSEVGALQAFDVLSGDGHAAFRSALTENSVDARSILTRRLLQAEAQPEEGVVFWAQARGNHTRLGGNGNASPLSHSSQGVWLGADAGLNNLRVGVAAGFGDHELKSADRSAKADSESWTVAAYASGRWSGLGLRGGATHSWHELESSRRIGFAGFSEAVKADYDATTTQVFAEAGYAIPTSVVTIEPFVSAAWVKTETDGFTETGSSAALKVADATQDITLATVGVGFSRVLNPDADRVTSVNLRVGYRDASGDVDTRNRQAFNTGDSFLVEGLPVADEAIVLDLGVDVKLRDRLSLNLDWNAQAADKHAGHALSAQLRWRF